MKQLYFTSCVAGRSVTGESGFRIRAVSSGVNTHRSDRILKAMGYTLPASMASADESSMPVRLALVKPPDAELVLCHSVNVGLDPASGRRLGNFFSHALFELDAGVDARRAILSWGSEFWRRRDDDAVATQLPDVSPEELPEEDRLAGRLTALLADEAGRAMIRYVMNAVLVGDPQSSIYLVAPAEQVALAVYAVTRALPPGLRSDLTFSTYEENAMTSHARLIGTWWGEGRNKKLPSACTRDGALAFDTSLGTPLAELPSKVPYAEWAVDVLAQSDARSVDEFVAQGGRLGLADLGQLDVLYQVVVRKQEPTLEHLSRAQGAPALLAWLAGRPKTFGRLAGWVLSAASQGKAEPVFRAVVAAIQDDAAAHTALADAIVECARAAVGHNNTAGATLALEGLLPQVDAPRATSSWWELCDIDPRQNKLTADAWAHILERMAAQNPEPDWRQLEPWLTVRPDDLERMLSLKLPPTWPQRMALFCLLREGKTGAAVRKAVAADPKLLVFVVVNAYAKGHKDLALNLFSSIVEKAAPSYQPVTFVLDRAPKIPAEIVDACLAQAIAAITLTHHEEAIAELQSWPGSQSPRPPGMPEKWKDARAALRNLGRLACPPPPGASLYPQTWRQILSLRTLAPYLAERTIEESLADVAKLLELQPLTLRCELFARFRTALADRILDSHSAKYAETVLSRALAYLGPVRLTSDSMPEGRGTEDLYRRLYRDCRAKAGRGFDQIDNKAWEAFDHVGYGHAYLRGALEELRREREGLGVGPGAGWPWYWKILLVLSVLAVLGASVYWGVSSTSSPPKAEGIEGNDNSRP